MKDRGGAAALAVEHGVDDLYQGAVPALVPALVAARGYDYAQAGGIVLAATLLSAVAQPLFGLLADRSRAGWLRSAGLLTAAGGIGAVGLLHSYTGTWVAVLVSGFGIAAYHPEAARAVHATGTGDRGMGWFVFGGMTGFAVGTPLVGWGLATLGLGASPLLVVPAVAALALRPLTRPPAGGAARPDLAGPQQASRSVTDVGRDNDWPRFGWLSGIVMARSVLFYGLSAFLAVYLTRDLHAGAGTATVGISLFTGVGALVTLASGALTGRVGRVGLLRICYLAALPLLAVLVLVPDPGTVLVVAAALGAALNLPMPVHTTLAQQYLPHRLGVAAAVSLGLAVGAGGVASPALGALADHAGVTTTFAALLVLPGLAGAFTVPLGGRGATQRRAAAGAAAQAGVRTAEGPATSKGGRPSMNLCDPPLQEASKSPPGSVTVTASARPRGAAPGSSRRAAHAPRTRDNGDARPESGSNSACRPWPNE